MKAEPTVAQRRVARASRARETNFWYEQFSRESARGAGNAGFAPDFSGSAVSRRKSVLEPVPAELATLLATVSRGSRRTLAAIMMQGIAIVASRYSGRSHIVIGAEDEQGWDGGSGVFPVVVAASGALTVGGGLRRIAGDIRAAGAHMPYRFDEFASDLGRESGGANPFYDISVIHEAYRPNLSDPLAPAGINVYWAATETGKHIAASYDETRFRASTVGTILRLTVRCLLAGLADLDCTLDEIALFDRERADVPDGTGAAAKSYPH